MLCRHIFVMYSTDTVCLYLRKPVYISSNGIIALLHQQPSAPPLVDNPTILSPQLKTTLPPINHNIRAIHIPSRLRTEQHHHPRQLLRHAHPAHRIPLRPRPPRLLQPDPFIQHRIHIPRTNAVHPDAVHGPLGRQGGFQRQEGRFGGIVCGLGLGVVCPVGGDGGEEEDAAAGFLGDHLSECGWVVS